ncbi:MAG: MiaB/RimO family radical SAM methylthiotransferase [Actinobacteria bacterium]|nr:MiaB/RimO family radical SAM methylthiotransferase [Actinomycetota bacterium]MCL6104236.1 MiaB/RimO family radical SAM methylthiotransferase [Actinomycetota bacterium]
MKAALECQVENDQCDLGYSGLMVSNDRNGTSDLMSNSAACGVTSKSFWVETLGCAKNQVDSEMIVAKLLNEGFRQAGSPAQADMVVINTCAFIESARDESIDVIFELDQTRKSKSRLVVTGCMAQRYLNDLSKELPEVDVLDVSQVGGPDKLGHTLRRPKPEFPWAYVKISEGCDRKCGFCAIPSFKGPHRSRPLREILNEVESLNVPEIILIAQDTASWGKDFGRSVGQSTASREVRRNASFVSLFKEVSKLTERVRILYLYPFSLDDYLTEAILDSGVPYFDLSLQHVSSRLLRKMRRWGGMDIFLSKIDSIRRQEPEAVFRSSFIVGYPTETEEDHDQLLYFLQEAELDWVGFFPFSPEEGTYAYGLEPQVPQELVLERLSEASELQDSITMRKCEALIGSTVEVLVDSSGQARSYRQAPEIDGIVYVPVSFDVGSFYQVNITEARGSDLVAVEAVSNIADEITTGRMPNG